MCEKITEYKLLEWKVLTDCFKGKMQSLEPFHNIKKWTEPFKKR